MSLLLQATKTALGPGLGASFLASGGAAPYSYQVQIGGAGGTIDANGNYVAPAKAPTDQRKMYDVVQASDSSSPPATATLAILVGNPFVLVCEVIQRAMGLKPDRVWLWNSKVDMPEDPDLFVVVGIARQKPYSSGNYPSGATTQLGPGSDQVTKYTNVHATLDIHLYSRGMDAITRLPDMFMALAGPYSEQQQEGNGFYLARLPHDAVDASSIDGDAIPYHYVVSVDMMYQAGKVIQPDYFSSLAVPSLIYNS